MRTKAKKKSSSECIQQSSLSQVTQTDRERLEQKGGRVEGWRWGGRRSEETEETLQDEGAAEEKGQLLFLSYGNGNEVGHGAGDNGELRAG